MSRTQPWSKLHHSSNFKKPLQVVNLSKRHGHQNQGFKKGPEDHSAVRVVVDWGDKQQTVCEDTLLTQVNSPEGTLLLALCILSRTSMYSCSCFTAVMATASSLIISSSLFWWAETDTSCKDACRTSSHLASDATCQVSVQAVKAFNKAALCVEGVHVHHCSVCSLLVFRTSRLNGIKIWIWCDRCLYSRKLHRAKPGWSLKQDLTST